MGFGSRSSLAAARPQEVWEPDQDVDWGPRTTWLGATSATSTGGRGRRRTAGGLQRRVGRGTSTAASWKTPWPPYHMGRSTSTPRGRTPIRSGGSALDIRGTFGRMAWTTIDRRLIAGGLQAFARPTSRAVQPCRAGARGPRGWIPRPGRRNDFGTFAGRRTRSPAAWRSPGRPAPTKWGKRHFRTCSAPSGS